MSVQQFPLSAEEREIRKQNQRMLELYESVEARFGRGVVGVVCGEQGRWTNFTNAMTYLIRPMGTMVLFEPGVDITKQCNAFINAARQRGDEWLWIIGDDHVFNPDIILQLLDHDLDVVVPNVLQRSAPFYPVVYDGIREEDGHHMIKYDLPEHGVHEVFAAGSAGMLIRKQVIDKLPAAPFQRWGATQNEDLEFCRLTREAGFKIWCDVDTQMAHIGVMNVWPVWSEEYGWGANLEIGPVNAQGVSPKMPVFRIAPGSAALRSA